MTPTCTTPAPVAPGMVHMTGMAITRVAPSGRGWVAVLADGTWLTQADNPAGIKTLDPDTTGDAPRIRTSPWLTPLPAQGQTWRALEPYGESDTGEIGYYPGPAGELVFCIAGLRETWDLESFLERHRFVSEALAPFAAEVTAPTRLTRAYDLLSAEFADRRACADRPDERQVVDELAGLCNAVSSLIGRLPR